MKEVAEVTEEKEVDYKTAFSIACSLLNGDSFGRIDADRIFDIMMKRDGSVCSLSYEEYIIKHMDYFTK